MESLNFLNLKSGDLAIFCGAGISRNSGLPLVRELKKSILEKLELDEDEFNELMDFNIPFEAFIEILAETMDIIGILDIFKQGEPNINHIFIAKLAKIGIIKTIVTTNFDLLIEKTLGKEGLRENVDFKRYYIEQDFTELESEDSTDKIRLIKIHGTCDHIDSIRTTLKKYCTQSSI